MVKNGREDAYLLGELDDKVFVKILGNATMKNSKTLADIFDKIFMEGKKQVIIELSECKYMDSTVLGTLAKFSIRIKKSWQQNLYAINVPGNIKIGFKSTGIDRFIEVLEKEENLKVETKKVESSEFMSKEEKTMHILEAHKILMGLSDENKKAFKNVVELLEKEIT